MRIDAVANLLIDNDGESRQLQFRCRLDPEQFTQRLILDAFRQGQFYESATSRFLASVLRPGDSFLDVGAHVGYFTLLAALLTGSTGSVWSFEPERGNYEHLLTHLELNGLTNVLPLNWAASSDSGVAGLFVNADNDGGHALWDVGRHPVNELSRGQPVRRPVFAVALDRLFQERPPQHLRAIKIDTEGNELAVLRGASRLLGESGVPYVICEINHFGLEQTGSSETAICDLMDSLGFDPFVLASDDGQLARHIPDANPQLLNVFNVVFVRRGIS